MPVHHPPNSDAPVVPVTRYVRRLLQTVRHPTAMEALSWLAWVSSVAVFAVWTYLHYRAPTGPYWIGMTIRTGVFATWTQALREWLMIRMHNRRNRYSDSPAIHQ